MKSFSIGNLKVPVPIIQGGMGIGISMSGLASAVANMGGVGLIATVGIGLTNNPNNLSYKQSSIDVLREEIRKARELSKGIIGVNIMTVLTNFSDMVKTSIEEGVDVIFSGAGLPLDLPSYLGEGIKTKLVPIVSSARAASIICNKWKQNFNRLPDAFVVEGPKAGGHLGFKPNAIDAESNHLENLVSDVLGVTTEMKGKYDIDIPVIAAGGIFDGKDIHDIMEVGASAVQMGTRFVATEECDADVRFKEAYVSSKEEDIQIIKSPVGLPGRTIYNEFMDKAYNGLKRPKSCKYNCIKTCDPKTTSYCIADALKAGYEGELNDGFVFVGANAWKIDKISTVKDVFNELTAGYAEAEKNKK